MEKVAKIFLLSVFVFFLLIAGCEDQFFSSPSPTTAPSEKKARLIAVENVQLKDQIQQLNAKIKKERASIEKIKQENVNLKNELQQDTEQLFEDMVISVLETAGKENEQLRAENERLSSEVTQLKEQSEELKKALEEQTKS